MNTKRNHKPLRLQRDTLRTLTDAELAAIGAGRRNGSENGCPPPSKPAPCPTTEAGNDP